MTRPGNEGEVWIEAHADTSAVEPELERGVDRAAERAENDLKQTGRDMGDALSEGIGDSLGSHGKDFAKEIEDTLEDEEVKVRVRYKYVKDRKSGQIFRKAFYEEIKDGFEEVAQDVFRSVSRSGSFQRIGQGISEAIGAGFNISGRSQLIPLLVIVLGAISNLVIAIIASLQIVGALLLSIPTLLASIGLQAGVVAIAFMGIADNVKAAFAAKNAKELQEALQNMRPEARAFVKELLPLKELFSSIKSIVESRFFAALGTNIGGLIKAISPILRGGFGNVAEAMGNFFHELTAFFQSPTFIKFLDEVFPLTVQWVERFGPAFIMFLDGLIASATFLMPFLRDFGSLLSGELEILGTNLKDFATDPENKKFLDTLYELTKSFFELINAASDFVSTLINSIVEAGGQEAIDQLTDSFRMLSDFFASDWGKESLKAFIDMGIVATQVLTGLIILFFSLLVLARSVALFFQWLWESVLAPFFTWVGERILEFVDWLFGVETQVERVGSAFLRLGEIISIVFTGLNIELRDKGASLIGSLIAGMKSQYGPLSAAAVAAAGIIGAALPGSPAKVGPLSGSGYSYYRGQALVKDFAAGIQSESNTLSTVSNETMGNINFGPGSIRVGFEGTVPTPEQARVTGSAVGQGILGTLAARNTRLAVRTL